MDLQQKVSELQDRIGILEKEILELKAHAHDCGELKDEMQILRNTIMTLQRGKNLLIRSKIPFPFVSESSSNNVPVARGLACITQDYFSLKDEKYIVRKEMDA